MRLICEDDKSLSNYLFWACQNSYRKPILKEAKPPACSSQSCPGDVVGKFEFKFKGKKIKENCLWSIESPQVIKERCSIPEVKKCCESCCDTCNVDSGLAFEAVEEKKLIGMRGKRTCDWLNNQFDASTAIGIRLCKQRSVQVHCCYICNNRVPSNEPSSAPIEHPTTVPTITF